MIERVHEAPADFLAALASRGDMNAGELRAALAKRPLWFRTGKVVDGEKPLPIGTRLNLRRGHPSGEHPNDLRWVVCGYRIDHKDRWNGYGLHRRLGDGVESTILGRCEDFDLVERFEIPRAAVVANT